MTIHVSEDTTMRYYKTFNVYDDNMQIGAVQCKGVCFGVTADPKHKHGPWITFIGGDNRTSKNFGPLVDDLEAAINCVAERHRETIQDS